MGQETITDKYELYRDDSGKFLPGNPGGAPPKITLKMLREAARDEMSPDKVRNVVKATYEEAVSGNVKAQELYLGYALGKPKAADDVDSSKLDILQIAIASMQKSQ